MFLPKKQKQNCTQKLGMLGKNQYRFSLTSGLLNGARLTFHMEQSKVTDTVQGIPFPRSQNLSWNLQCHGDGASRTARESLMNDRAWAARRLMSRTSDAPYPVFQISQWAQCQCTKKPVVKEQDQRGSVSTYTWVHHAFWNNRYTGASMLSQRDLVSSEQGWRCGSLKPPQRQKKPLPSNLCYCNTVHSNICLLQVWGSIAIYSTRVIIQPRNSSSKPTIYAQEGQFMPKSGRGI